MSEIELLEAALGRRVLCDDVLVDTAIPQLFFDHFSRISQRHTIPNTPCNTLDQVSILIGWGIGACNPMLCPIHVFSLLLFFRPRPSWSCKATEDIFICGDQFLTHCSVTQRYAAATRAVWLALLSARAYRMLTGACYPTLRPIPVSLLDLGFDSRFFFCLKAVRLAQLDGNLPWPWSWPRVSDLPPSRRPSRRVAHLSARSSLPTRSPTHSTKRARLQTRALNGGRGDGNRTA